MCPFIEDNEEDVIYNADSEQKFEGGMVSQFFQNDRKYIVIGGTAVAIVLIAMIGIIRSSMTPVNIEELPLIQAETTPIKEKPEKNNQVKHQDKVVYDNISGDHREVVEKVASKPEEVLSIPEIDVSESLSAEDKQTIIQAFDNLAPDKEFKINYIEKHPPINSKLVQENFSSLTNDENETLRKLKSKKELSDQEKAQLSSLTKKISDSYKPGKKENLSSSNPITNQKAKKRRHSLKDIIATKIKKEKLAENVSRSRRGTIMVQIASVSSKAAAESEYNRLVSRNRFLRGKGKKIYKVDLGPTKGVKYRIQIGPFKNKAEANKIIAAMRDNGCAAYISR